MAKRFTDSDKWKDPWFKKLPGRLQLFWLFALDTCDHAGIWKIQFDEFEYKTGFKFNPDDMEYFSERIFYLDDETYFIPRFITFQYSKFNPDRNNAHKGVLKVLDHYAISLDQITGHFLTIRKHKNSEGLASPCLAPQDKDKEKDMDMDMDMEKDKEKEKGGLILSQCLTDKDLDQYKRDFMKGIKDML
jgi:hypothetical protein